MSSSDQVSSDYYHYVCAYIVAKSGLPAITVMQSIKSGQYSFILSDPGTGVISISNWNVANVPQPQSSDLMALTPGSAQSIKKVSLVSDIAIGMPKVFTLLMDIYNRINTMPNNGTYKTNADLMNYLTTLF